LLGSSYDAATTSSQSSTRKVVRFSSYRLLDNYIIRLLSYQNNEKFKILLLRLTVSCEILDRQTLGRQILEKATNVKNEQLLGVMIITSEGRPYIWKAVDISSEGKSYVLVMEKINIMIDELKSMNIKVLAVVTDNSVELFLPSFLKDDINYQTSINSEHIGELDEIDSESEEFVNFTSNKNDEFQDSNSLEEFGQFLDDNEVLSSLIKDIVHLSLDPNSK
ncbi:5632_t:CDS:2, partial [Scutellospora calospora]